MAGGNRSVDAVGLGRPLRKALGGVLGLVCCALTAAGQENERFRASAESLWGLTYTPAYLFAIVE